MTRSGKIFLGNIQTRKVVKVKEVFAENDNDQLNCGIQKEGNRYLLGTLSTKLLWYDLEKNQISSNADFQNVIKNNPIIDLFVTFKGNLWILENNGLNFFSYNSTYQNIFDKASVFDILIKNKIVQKNCVFHF